MKEKANAASVLFAVFLVLAEVSRYLGKLISGLSGEAFLSAAVVQLAIYLLPLAFYCRIGDFDYFSSMKIRLFSVRRIPFFIVMCLLWVSSSAFMRYLGLTFFDGAMTDTPSAVYIPAEGNSAVLVFICYIILPAVLEELVFRGILLSHYSEYGYGIASFVTSLMYAMMHLDTGNFVYYFITGLILASISVVCESSVPSMILHIIINFSYFYVREDAVDYIRQTGKSALLPFVMVVLILLFLFLMFSALEILYDDLSFGELVSDRKKLVSGDDTAESAVSEGKVGFTVRLKKVFLSPAFLLCAALFFVFAADLI